MEERERLLISKNGVKIYSYRNPSLHSFYISLFVKAGVMYEEERFAGITHFLEHVAIRNVNRLYNDELYRELDRRGLEFNASTYSEMVQLFVSGSTKNFDTGADIIAKLLDPIVLTASDLNAERKRIKAEIRESDDKNSLASFTNRIVFGGTSLANSIVGTNRAIDGITRSRLEEYRRSVMSRDNIFFYVTGNFSDGDLLRLSSLIEKRELSVGHSNSDEAPVPESFGKRPLEVHVKTADFSMVRFTFDLDMTKYSVAETDLLYDILLSGYSSALFVEMSEKHGLFYDITGAVERYKNVGTLYFSFETKSSDIPEAVSMVVDILNSMKAVGGIDSEIVKAGYVDNAEMLYDDSRELNFTFAYDNHIMEEKYSSITERKKRYENITSERLSEIAAEVFRACNLTLTMKAQRGRVDTEKIKKVLEGLK